MHFVIVIFIIQDEHKTRWTVSGSMHHLWPWENLSINMSSPCQHWTWRTPDLYDIIFKNSHSISVRLRKIFTFCLLSTKQNFINPMTLHSAHCPSCGYYHLVPWTLVPTCWWWRAPWQSAQTQWLLHTAGSGRGSVALQGTDGWPLLFYTV